MKETKNKGLMVNYGLVVKHDVDTEILMWAIWYHKHVAGKPLKKLSKTGINRFLKEQMYQFGNGEFLFGTSWADDFELISDEEYEEIENTLHRIFF